ncbi:MAG: hypothetical protein ACHP7D_04510 [Lysobacterales bacterium]
MFDIHGFTVDELFMSSHQHTAGHAHQVWRSMNRSIDARKVLHFRLRAVPSRDRASTEIRRTLERCLEPDQAFSRKWSFRGSAPAANLAASHVQGIDRCSFGIFTAGFHCEFARIS